jgi:hypothetical protein
MQLKIELSLLKSSLILEDLVNIKPKFFRFTFLLDFLLI